MQKFEEKFFKVLINKYRFYIKEYFSSYDNKKNYVAILEQRDFLYCVIIGNNKNINNRLQDATKQIEENQSKKVLMNVVVIGEDLYELQLSQQCGKVFYSEYENNVIYSDEISKLLADELKDNKLFKRKNIFKNKEITISLIAINIIIFFITALMSKNIMNINIYTLVLFGAKVNQLIDLGDYWRLVACTFLHGGVTHLFFNMYSLNIIGTTAEKYYGKIKYIIIYLLSGLGGTIASYIFNSDSVSVGASGAVFGLLGAMLYYGIKNRETINKRYINSILQVIILNIFIGLTISNIDNAGHIGGLIVGFMSSLILSSKLFNKKINKNI